MVKGRLLRNDAFSVRCLLRCFVAGASCVAAHTATGQALYTGVGTLKAHYTPHFAIQHDASLDWAADLGEHLESMADRFYRQMAVLGARRPSPAGDELRLAWLCLVGAAASQPSMLNQFSASYDTRLRQVELVIAPAYASLDGGKLASDAATAAFLPGRRNFMDDNRLDLFTRMSHEVAHQLAFDCGLQKAGVMYPLWLAEGLATNFESPQDADGDLPWPNPMRQERLQALGERQVLLPLARLVSITDVEGLSRQARIDLYAQFWGLFRFLALEQTPALTAHLQTLASLPCGRRTRFQFQEEMRHSFGPMLQLEKAWQGWVLRL